MSKPEKKKTLWQKLKTTGLRLFTFAVIVTAELWLLGTFAAQLTNPQGYPLPWSQKGMVLLVLLGLHLALAVGLFALWRVLDGAKRRPAGAQFLTVFASVLGLMAATYWTTLVIPQHGLWLFPAGLAFIVWAIWTDKSAKKTLPEAV